jgi:hypothetical protein
VLLRLGAGIHIVHRRTRDLHRLARKFGFSLARSAGHTSSWRLVHPSGVTIVAAWTPSDRAWLRVVARDLRRALRNGRERM